MGFLSLSLYGDLSDVLKQQVLENSKSLSKPGSKALSHHIRPSLAHPLMSQSPTGDTPHFRGCLGANDWCNCPCPRVLSGLAHLPD